MSLHESTPSLNVTCRPPQPLTIYEDSWFVLNTTAFTNLIPGHRYLSSTGYWLNGHEFEETLGDSEGEASLACCSPWGRRDRHDWATKQQLAALSSPCLFFHWPQRIETHDLFSPHPPMAGHRWGERKHRFYKVKTMLLMSLVYPKCHRHASI